MDDESVTLPPTAVEKEVDGLTSQMGAPYMDVDAELFLSAHGLPQNTRRKRTVRLLERLFAPPVGTINVEEARFLSALDLGRREREMISAARATTLLWKLLQKGAERLCFEKGDQENKQSWCVQQRSSWLLMMKA